MNNTVRDKALFGIIGISSLILGLYIGYWYLVFVKDSGISFLTLFWQFGDLKSLITTVFLLILGCLVSVLVFVIVSNFLSLAYSSLINAITGSWPNRDWVIYKGLGKIAIYGMWIVFILFSVGGFLYGSYVHWDPHIGEYVLKDDLVILMLEKIEAIDELNPYANCDNIAGPGWKFIILDYYISSINKTKHLSMTAGDIVDENGISYSNYYNECLPIEEYYHQQEVLDHKMGKLVYKIPLNAVPAKIPLSIRSNNTEFALIEISLHKRRFL